MQLDFSAGSATWWNAAWKQRQCFTVTSAEAESEYPLRFVVDTAGVATAANDIRVVEGSTGTLLTTYAEGPFPSASSVVWAQAEPLPAGVSTYCVYFDNGTVPSISDEIGTFTYTTGQRVSYYTLVDEYSGNGVKSRQP
ncbi:MAG: hypothetical protein R2706_04590 [Acidimicrobiales bacterium]